MRFAPATLLAGLVLALVGCGGSDSASTSAQGAASIAPASAAVYATVNSDLDSDQVNQLEELLAKFPDRERLFDEFQKSLTEENLSWENDIQPALGNSVDFVMLDFSDDAEPYLILKPADKAKLDALLQKSDDPPVTREIDGWTVVSTTEADLDSFENARSSGSLESSPEFEAAMDDLPDDALARLYVNGEAVTKVAQSAGGAAVGKNRLNAIALALGAESSGISLEGAVTADLEDKYASLEPYESELIEAAPEGALAFISANGGGRVADALEEQPGTVGPLRDLLGGDLEGVGELFDGEFAIWVGQGIPIPELTFLAEVEDEQRAMAALDRLVRLIPPETGAQSRSTEIDGVQAKQVVVDGLPITYAVFDGKAIVTSRPGAIGDVRSGGDSLADDPTFEQAKEDADMPDETFGFVYLDVGKLGDFVEGIAGLSGESIPPEATRSLEPLGAFLFAASGEPDDLKLSAFLSID
jgi:hypothetical protein